jgi:hypothetical protein
MRKLLIAGTVAPLRGGGNLFATAAIGNDGATKRSRPVGAPAGTRRSPVGKRKGAGSAGPSHSDCVILSSAGAVRGRSTQKAAPPPLALPDRNDLHGAGMEFLDLQKSLQRA